MTMRQNMRRLTASALVLAAALITVPGAAPLASEASTREAVLGMSRERLARIAPA